MIKRLLLASILIGGIFAGLFGWKYYQIQQAKQGRGPPPPAVVAVTEVRRENWQPYLSAVGSLVAVSGIEVANETAGKVSRIRFDSGQAVEQGQMLIELDTATDQATLDGLLSSQRLAQIKFDRRAKLLASRSVSKSDYDEAEAVLDEARAAVQAQRALIDKKHIHAPFSGRLGIRMVDVGEYLAPGSPIVPLQALDPIYADFSLPERHLAMLVPRQAVVVRVQAYPGDTFDGRIAALDPGVDKGTRTLKIRATLDNPKQRLRPGMFAEVRVLLPQRKPVLTLPDSAITYNPYGDSVFVVESGEGGLTVQRRQIETGETRAGRVEIVAGLSAGQRVVSAGQVKLRNGMAVTLDDKPAPGEREAAR